MAVSYADRTVGQLVRERASRSRLFEDLGIDYCCGGNLPLGVACERRGIDVEDVSRRLAQADVVPAAAEGVDWTRASLTALADHIIEVHHDHMRRELPRLARLIDRVVEAHGARHPEMQDVSRVFRRLSDELASHTMKEEQILFPFIKQLERARADGAAVPEFHCGSVADPIAVMEHEHDDAGEGLSRLRALTGGYRTPDNGCNTFRALMDGLHALELDLHQHIHKENNILFPRAIELESRAHAGA